jgi:class 3 adenylate cyclase/tRNA A-37 threonylcarbamoyl transferase component Bud32
MPGPDGFEVLARMREGPVGWETPFLFVSARDDRASIRRAMSAGADDYLTKPCAPEELVEAVRAQLRKRDRRGLASGQARTAAAPADATGRVSRASVLFSDIRGFTAISERLMAGETAQLLNAWFERACRPVLGAGGSVAKFLGDGLMAVFEPLPDEPPGLHARRALAAGVAIATAAHEFAAWVRVQYPDRALPTFSAGVGIHSGEILFCRVGGERSAEDTVLGDPVNVAARLEEATKTLGWAVAASAAAVALVGEGVQTGARRVLDIRGRMEPMEVVEVLAVAGGTIGAPAVVTLAGGLRTALSENARKAALASKDALDGDLRAIERHGAERGLVLRDYRILRKLGSGTAAEVFLAERQSDSRAVALKVLASRQPMDSTLARRFAQEAALLSRIDHPNVVKVGRYALGEGSAFIEMEYLAGGTLRRLMTGAIRPRDALALTAQMAQAAGAVHESGIVHRDLKPSNFLLRTNGTAVLADFGVAKLLASDDALTRKGETLGTAHYLSPEQAGGAPVTPASDLYALGAILFEMLSGSKPYQGDFGALIAQHANAPVPRLPEGLAVFQDLVEGLMAKDLRDRLPDAGAALAALDSAWARAAAMNWDFEVPAGTR